MSKFKVVIVGEASAGKSSLVRRITEGDFQPCSPTVGCNFRTHVVKSTFGDDVDMQIWDTAGEERYHSITNLYYRRADAVIILYSVMDTESFQSATQYWLEQVKINCDDPIIFLVGNKTDLMCGGGMRAEESFVQKLSRDYGITYMECSAKSEDGVSKLVTTVADMLLERQTCESPGIDLEPHTYASYCRC